ncbi:type IV pili methyl-accepting chemotaxis transducer N-terminal domain-containing protein [Tepidimonas taiwanensis]|uniref:type IV pili methyl-accepting chemotaxis transducer N-terminal domain-containing protein n=1 Tax=Tepidimonas taiwanensis TaxID=307486 RepID=UPI0005B7C8D9|nr:type IV pili methyl-accepting chemotaxis transducer N-terminal domain-containing protein [Tepidimonas taiwanensis]
MRTRSTIATKLVYAGLSLLLAVAASIGVTLWVTWQLDGGAAAVNEAGRLRMQVWRLDAAQAQRIPASERAAYVREIAASLERLRAGDPQRPLFVPWTPTIEARFTAVQMGWESNRWRWEPIESVATPLAQEGMASFAAAQQLVRDIDALVQAIEHELARLTRALNLLQFVMIGLAVLGAVIMLHTGQRYVMQPLTRLARAMTDLQQGRFAARVVATRGDEFGQLAAGFNQMAATLQELYGQLEAKVAEKTRDLETKRANLQTLYEMSEFLSDADSLPVLAQGFVERLRHRMGAEAVVLRWAQDAMQGYVLLAEHQMPREIVAAERVLPCGVCECGRAHIEGRTRVIPIEPVDSAHPVQCADHGLRALISVPVRLQHQILGEINLFYRQPVVLHDGERELLDALAGQMANAVEGLRARALEREAAVAQERAFLARELHDSIAQSLAFLKIQVQLLQGALHRGDMTAIQGHVEELQAGLQESLADVRELLVHFRTRSHEGDIVAALQETATKFQHQTGMPVQVEVDGTGVELPADVQIQVLHVVQEALSNVRKHARARRVVMSVHKGEPWRFVVRDDGAGFDPAALAGETHVGLRIMRERAATIGATLHIEAAPQAGTTVTLTVPTDAGSRDVGPREAASQPARVAVAFATSQSS